MKLKEDDLVLCTVDRIVGTTVFVKIDGNGEGSIITSEIASGRIRNLRDYVVPNKKIVCKVLNIDSQGGVHLSLRRVTAKEKKEVIEKYEKEKSSLSILKSVLKDKAEEIAEEIKEKSSLYEFLQQCKETPKKLEKYFSKQETEKICKILSQVKEKQAQVKQEFRLTSKLPDGLEVIKDILKIDDKNTEISYLAAGRYQIKITDQDYKSANQKKEKILEKIADRAKNKAEFKIKEK